MQRYNQQVGSFQRITTLPGVFSIGSYCRTLSRVPKTRSFISGRVLVTLPFLLLVLLFLSSTSLADLFSSFVSEIKFTHQFNLYEIATFQSKKKVEYLKYHINLTQSSLAFLVSKFSLILSFLENLIKFETFYPSNYSLPPCFPDCPYFLHFISSPAQPT